MTRASSASSNQSPSLIHLVRHCVQHPVRTVRRNHRKSVDASGFGLGLLAVVGVFIAFVVTWVVNQLGPLLQ